MAYVRKEQPGIMIYWEAFDALEAMMDGEAKQMLKAIRMYAQYGEEPDFENNPSMKMAWYFMRGRIEGDKSRYEEIRDRNRQNGKKGGKASGESRRNSPGSWGF